MFPNLIPSILAVSSVCCPRVGSTDYLTIHFVSSKIFMFADIQMQLFEKAHTKPKWCSVSLPVTFNPCFRLHSSVMLVLSQLSPVAQVTDEKQSIPAVPAAGPTQAPSPGEGNAAAALKHQSSHQLSSFPLGR